MTSMLRLLASNRFTLAAFGALGATVLATHVSARLAPGWVALPLVAMALNLAAALLRHPVLRRGGLAVFHIALLGCLLLVAVGRLTHLEGRVEIAQGSAFDPAAVEVTSAGPWGSPLRQLDFTQGPFSVRYAPGLKRAHTRSEVTVPDGSGGATVQVVGDDHPLVLRGVRFYTTHNKGFAPELRWTAPGAAPVAGRLHLPSYPLFDWKQEQRWQAPGGPEMRFALRLARPLAEPEAWQFQPDQVAHVLVLQVGTERFELRPGEAAHGAFGELRYERLGGWMGYRIHHDPTMQALLVLALLGVAGLALHLWPLRLRTPRPARLEAVR